MAGKLPSVLFGVALALLAAAVAAALPFPASGGGRSLSIVYTGAVKGELEPCGCSAETDLGGLARRGGFLSSKAGELSPYVLVDAGNFAGSDTPQGRLKVEAMLEALGLMGYDAVALMGAESALPGEFLLTVIEGSGVPVLSGSPGYGKSRRVTKDGVEVNISVDPGEHREGMLNVLLTESPVSELTALAGWDVVVLSSGEVIEEPVVVDGALVVAGYPKGKRLGTLKLRLGADGSVSGFEHAWQLLGRESGEDERVRGVLDDYDARVARLLEDEGARQRGMTFMGVSKCAECHQPFADGWRATRHAGAFKSLERVGKAADPECLRCHTVGFGREGGFYSIGTTPELADVQCEACHGPGRKHLEDDYGPLLPVDEATCLGCHTAETSPRFEYREYLLKIKHP